MTASIVIASFIDLAARVRPRRLSHLWTDPSARVRMWRSSYAELARAGEAAHTQIAEVQRERLDVSHKEEDLDVDTEAENTEATGCPAAYCGATRRA